MNCPLMIAAAAAAFLTHSPTVSAQQGPLGTPQEARTMLEKAIAAVKADQTVALAAFNKGEGGFADRDLNTFCFRIGDGAVLASPRAVPAGTDVRTLKDPTGKNFGEQLYAAAQKPEGQITEVGHGNTAHARARAAQSKRLQTGWWIVGRPRP